jgi:hypothetical protein
MVRPSPMVVRKCLRSKSRLRFGTTVAADSVFLLECVTAITASQVSRNPIPSMFDSEQSVAHRRTVYCAAYDIAEYNCI